jgi:transcriptional regulator with XRE-family HTH domain
MRTLNQSDIARQAGVTKQMISMVLNGKCRPSVKLAKKLARITGRPFFDFRPDLKKLFKEMV